MSRHHADPCIMAAHSQNGTPRKRRPLGRHSLLLMLMLSLLVLSQVLSNWSVLIPSVEAASLGTPSSAPSNMTFQQFLRQGRTDKVYHGPLVRPSDKNAVPGPAQKHFTNYAQLPPSAEPATMKTFSQPLTAAFLAGSAGTASLDFKGSDGRLEVQIPPGALDLSHATVSGGGSPSGALTLQMSQVSGHSVGQMNGLGSYQLQITDSHGQVVNGLALRTPITIVYHYQASELQSLDIDPGHVILTWPSLIAAAQQAKQSTAGLVIPMQNDSTTHTLTAHTSVLGSHPFDLTAEPSNQSPPTQHLASMQGNNGQLSYSYPLQIAPGPGGFAPQLALTYSSAGPNERHSPTSAAGPEGDGWSLTLGSVSEETYAPSPGTMWYFLNDVAGVGDRLIPTGSNNLFNTEHISYLRVQQINPGTNGTCFHVWDKSGTYYELGCTADSLQYWTDSNGTQHDYQWDVNKIVAPSEGPNTGTYRLILVSYLQDSTSFSSGGHNYTNIRDAAVKQIIYGSGSINAVSSVAGTIDFLYRAPSNASSSSGDSSAVIQWATAYGNNYNCSSAPPDGKTTTLRCDDPIQKSGGFTPPVVVSTLSLQQVYSYVGTDGSSSNTDARYDFSYTDNPFQACNDPITLAPGYCAREHLLMTITPNIYQNGTANTLPQVIFGYTNPLNDTYYDSVSGHTVGSPPQQYFNQTWWQYLNFYRDLNTGIGGQVVYATAYNNAHGTPTDTNYLGKGLLDDRHDPLYCVNHQNSQASLQCTGVYAHPDDNAWAEQVVTQLTVFGTDSSNSALQTATTTYNYQLAITGSWDGKTTWCEPDQYIPADTDCVGDNWLPKGDSDWQDYYHAEYQGFKQVLITSPSNDLTVKQYYSTEGWFTPGSDYQNYLGSNLYETDVYSGNNATSSALLSRTTINYVTDTSACLSTTATYPPCEAVVFSTRTTEYDQTGSGNSNAPWVEHDYTYDDWGEFGLIGGYHNLLSDQISGSNLPTSIYPILKRWTYANNDTTTSNPTWTYYTVGKPIHSEVDAGSNIWLCQDITYDEGAGSGIPTPSAGEPTTVKTYSNSACTQTRGSPMTTTYAGYDVYGNVVASVDAVATANSPLYNSSGCSASPVIVGSGWGLSRYTGCVAYDSYHAQVATTTNAFGQSTGATYDYTQGSLPISATDLNGQQTTTSYSYSNGNLTTQVKLPLASGSYTNRSSTKTSCAWNSSLPCFEIDKNSYLYNTVQSSTFYDSHGRAVETRTPGPGSSYDTIVMTVYNDQAHTVWQSVPFQVTHGSGWVDPNNAKDYQNNTPGGTVTFYDALGRTIAVQDPNIGQGSDGIACSATLSGNYTACTNYSIGQVSGDSNYYVSVSAVDPNKHVTVSYIDALGRTVYTLEESGLYGGMLTPVQKTATQYNALDKPTSVTVTDLVPQSGQSVTSVTTSASYDDLGRLITLNDPDRGSHSYTYDGDGHMITDVSGTRTIGYVYDLLSRVGCVQNMAPTESATGACTSGANAHIQNTYDTTTLGTQGSTDFPVGRLTKSVSTTYYPGGTSAQVTELYQHDARGRLIDEKLSFPSLPSGWNITTALPSYKVQYTYNDADQLTTTQTSTAPTGLGYTITQVYDATTGVQTGLSDNSTNTPDLATLSFNARAQVSSINYLTSGGSSALAIDQFSYDANLRPITDTANWQSGSGNGTAAIFSQSRTFDPASNLISLTTTQAAVPNVNGSGGTETSNFCYDEQNRLVWAGNSGTQPGAGNGTCGSGTLSSGLTGASYSDSYVYTHLGQLYQAPLNGSGTQEQYLYCGSSTSAPHQLVGLYPISSGATCSNYTGKTADYSSSYDTFGNVTSRTFSSTTGTLSYDLLDQFTKWFVSATNQEQYVYDSSGNRVLRRSTNNSGTTMTVYAFGLEEHVYSGSGTNQWNTYYYSLAGRLIGANDANGTVFYMTDTLGSILASFTNAPGGATLKGNQVFGPYGNARYYQGSINTAKGFTGQYNDSLTGLDYYNARYYDPVAGVFLSADRVQGNGSGDNPYAYVNGNPETNSDPSGLSSIALEELGAGAAGGEGELPGASGGGDPGSSTMGNTSASNAGDTLNWSTTSGNTVTQYSIDPNTGFITYQMFRNGMLVGGGDVPDTGGTPKAVSAAVLASLGIKFNFPDPVPGGFSISLAPQPFPSTQTGGSGRGNIPPITVSSAAAPCSFTSDTPVATDHGKKAIGKLHVGDKVLAYNPKTHKMEWKTILHVWTHTDSDLVDVTISYSVPAPHGKGTIQKSEVLHTTSEHPFMTTEHGFMPAGSLKTGMHVLRADGSVGVITGWKVVHGTKTMYNLEVAQDHTFTVGDGQWVVHNACGPQDYQQLRNNLANAGRPVQSGQNPHHIVPCALRNHPLVQQAINGGFDFNGEYNGRPLWDYNNKANALVDIEPYHANSPSYLRLAKGLLDDEYQRLGPGLTPNDAYDSVMYVINVLNSAIDYQGYMGLLAGVACPLPGI